ncbi:hypothetical protein C2845_PM05G19630 [Panicum miliaceum]|uniref:Uncharacterized protein n=1 Tax=Panicum miliaceum TaxID=4540 RepID=A0A3L6ST16_PANMI|nr:hypothetical protein C2845_PM05G19630 [Panicum miliaceum]
MQPQVTTSATPSSDARPTLPPPSLCLQAGGLLQHPHGAAEGMLQVDVDSLYPDHHLAVAQRGASFSGLDSVSSVYAGGPSPTTACGRPSASSSTTALSLLLRASVFQELVARNAGAAAQQPPVPADDDGAAASDFVDAKVEHEESLGRPDAEVCGGLTAVARNLSFCKKWGEKHQFIMKIAMDACRPLGS